MSNDERDLRAHPDFVKITEYKDTVRVDFNRGYVSGSTRAAILRGALRVLRLRDEIESKEKGKP